uniref:hypothetical protein n=1 Tax=Blastomonas sp. TaxID=1909299 RepID=UPI003592FAD8
MRRWLIGCLLLAGCSETRAGGDDAPSVPLEAAAIEAGVITDADALDLAGVFSDASGTGADGFCASGNRIDGYDIGLIVTFGPDIACEAVGRAALSGEEATISLTETGSGKPLKGCTIKARFDGSALILPGRVPDGCAIACAPRASLSG